MVPRLSKPAIVLASVIVALTALAWWVSRSPVPSVSLPVAALPGGLEVRCLNGSVWPSEDRASAPSSATGTEGAETWPLTVAAHEVPEIEVVSRLPLELVTLEFERRAAARIELEGGRVIERILRPDGRVLFQVAPEPADRERSWPFPPNYRYRLRWVMPTAPGGPLGMTVRAVAAQSNP